MVRYVITQFIDERYLSSVWALARWYKCSTSLAYPDDVHLEGSTKPHTLLQQAITCTAQHECVEHSVTVTPYLLTNGDL
jgi:hypothetical protein